MRRTRLTALIAVVFLGASVMDASAAVGPSPKAPISNPFHEFTGYPGLKLGYGTVLAQCQTYDNAGNTNPYAPFTTTVDMIVDDPINVGAGVNQGCRTPQNETSIAVNPADPRNLVAGANDYRLCCVPSGGTLRNDGSGWVYTSTDGGATWRNVKLPGLGPDASTSIFKKVTSVGDPAIAFGSNNTVYYANIAFNRVDESDAIIVSVSHDGGLSWDEPKFVANSGGATFFNDKVWVGADPTSGRALVSWTVFKQSSSRGYISSRILAARTADFGKTWGSGIDVSGPYLYNQGSFPVFAPGGAVYVAFEGAVAADGYNDYLIVSKSTNGGKTFSQTVAGRIADESYPVDPVLGRQVLTGLRFRINSFPSFAVDRVTGRLWATWADNSLGTTALTSSQVFVQSSMDGVTWTPKTRVTAGSADRIYPAIAANDGNVIVSFYTREYAPSGEIDYAYVKSNDAGATWSSTVRLTEESSDPAIQFTLGGFIGDYTGVAVGSDNVAHPVWTDFRGHPGVTSPNQDAVTTAVRLVP